MARYNELFLLFEDSGWKTQSEEARARLNEKIQTKSAELLSAIAKAVRIKIDQIQILKGAYAPQGWADDEQINRAMKAQAAKFLRGEITLPVAVVGQAGSQSSAGAVDSARS